MSKEAKRVARMLAKSREYQCSTYVRNFVAPEFQKMIRAEAGAKVGYVDAVVDGEIEQVFSPLGQCVCVTCGVVLPWKGTLEGQGMDAGHCFPGKRNSFRFEETACHPQCKYDNRTGGHPAAMKLLIVHRYGADEFERLRNLKANRSRRFTREELVAMRLEYLDRIKVAVGEMEEL